MPEPINIFFAYARADQALRDELDIHLAFLRRSNLIKGWYDGNISAGEDWQQAIHQHLHTADIILLLVSPDFIASDYCYDVEMKKAMARHEAGEVVVIPVILRPCRWQRTPFAQFQALPKDARPITVWPNRDQAFDSAVEAIDQTAHQLYAKRNAPLSTKSLPNFTQANENRAKVKVVKKAEPTPVSLPRPVDAGQAPKHRDFNPPLIGGAVVMFSCLLLVIIMGTIINLTASGELSWLSPSPTPTPKPPSPTPRPTPDTSSLPETITDFNNSPMILIPTGPFEMGSEDGEDDEKPVHTVTLDDYYIDQYEVTNAQFVTFLNDQGNQTEAGVTWLDADDEDVRIRQTESMWMVDDGYASHPISEVTWYGAQAYCNWREARLPTEAEWEKAARGTDGRTYPWGEQTPDGQLLNFLGIVGDTMPVNSYPEGTSPYRVYNMGGNVWEWVDDWYDSAYYSNSPEANPIGPPFGNERVVRGGGWNYIGNGVRSALRFRFVPTESYSSIGFRCARSP